MNTATTSSKVTFEQVRDEVRSDDAGKWDLVAPREQLQFEGGALTVSLDDCGQHIERLTPTAWATTQFCQRLGIPASYFRKCPPQLQDAQGNYWIKNAPSEPAENGGKRRSQHTSKPEQWLLRARYGVLRGVLSERYSRLDNEALLTSVQQVLETVSSRFETSWFALSDESLHLRLIDPTQKREALPDDGLMAGIHIANSEVGKRAVTVDAMVFRLVCSNGLIRLVKGKSLLYQRHIHLSQDRFAGALETAVGEALGAATSFMDQIAVATRESVKDVEEAIKKISGNWNLSQSTEERVLQALLEERSSQQETLYGVVNAFTNAAQTLPADDRYDLEVLAGHLVEHGIAQSLRVRSSAKRRAGRERTSDPGRNGDFSNGRHLTAQDAASANLALATKFTPLFASGNGDAESEVEW